MKMRNALKTQAEVDAKNKWLLTPNIYGGINKDGTRVSNYASRMFFSANFMGGIPTTVQKMKALKVVNIYYRDIDYDAEKYLKEKSRARKSLKIFWLDKPEVNKEEINVEKVTEGLDEPNVEVNLEETRYDEVLDIIDAFDSITLAEIFKREHSKSLKVINFVRNKNLVKEKYYPRYDGFV